MVTGSDIRKELQGDYTMYNVAVIVFAAIAGFCAVFCGTQLGWKHLFTIISLALLGVAVIVFIVLMIKLMKVRSNKLFKKYGTAEAIAEHINQGMRSPYFRSNTLLITDRFIVNEGRYSGYMELKDIRSIRPQYIPDVKRVTLGPDIVSSVVETAASNYVSQRYRDSQGITATNRFDTLIIIDNEGKQHEYAMHHMDAEQVLGLFAQILPNVEIKL